MKRWLTRFFIFGITLIITLSSSWQAWGRSATSSIANTSQERKANPSVLVKSNTNQFSSSLTSNSTDFLPKNEVWESAQLMLPNRVENRYRTNDMWQAVYAVMPELPLENNYKNTDTGEEPDEDYTLIRRLIRYHIYNQNRPPLFRLDWKLTLADYLGANEQINLDTYPGANVLEPHPLDGDRAAIASLSPQQRDRLVEVLVSLFNPNYVQLVEDQASIEAQTPAIANTQPGSETPRNSDLPTQPQPGDAQLLIPSNR